jgi:chemotaxis protein CheC
MSPGGARVPLPEPVLAEVGRLGSEHAAMALRSLLDVPASVCAVKTQRVAALDLAALPKAPGDLFLGVLFDLHGERMGHVLVLLERGHAFRLVGRLGQGRRPEARVFDEAALSVVREVANILVGAYLGAIRGLVHLPLLHSIPRVAMDQWETILNSLVPAVADEAERVFLIETELALEGDVVRLDILVVAGDWQA